MVTNYEAKMDVANTARRFGYAMPTARNARVNTLQVITPEYSMQYLYVDPSASKSDTARARVGMVPTN